ncbi:MAG: Hint domain-containing protein [Brevirhabdus sp.]
MADYTLDWDVTGADGSGTFLPSGGGDPVGVTVSTPTNGDGDHFSLSGGVLCSSGVHNETTISVGFDHAVENVSFEIFDVDAGSGWDDKVTIIARDASGNIVDVDFSDLIAHHQVSGNSVEGGGNDSPGVEGSGAPDTVTVTIPGPIVSLEIIHEDGDSNASSGTVKISDMTFDAYTAPLDGIVEGTSGNDYIDDQYTGDPEGDCIDANDGTNGTTGDQDVVEAGAGNDTILSGEEEDLVYAGEGHDRIMGGNGDDTIYGEAGNDYASGDAGDDLIYLGTGNDKGSGDAGNDTIFGEDGDDTINGGDGADVLDGGDDNDTIHGGDDNDTIYGGAGDDYASGQKGDDVLYMGAGNDRGSGASGNDTIYGEDGDDTLKGEKGNDVLDGGLGSDSLLGGSDRDTIYGDGGDYVDGGSKGDDHDTLIVEDVTDVTYTSSDHEDGIVTFADGSTLTFKEIENLVVSYAGDGIVEGTSGDDLIDTAYTGDPEGDMIDNGDAILPGEGPEDDIVLAGAGDDTVLAGLGDDEVHGGTGNDSIEGGVGDDELYGGGTTTVRESFEWDQAPGFADNALASNFTQDTGNVDVTFTVVSADSGVLNNYETNDQYVNGIVDDGSPVDDNSSFESVTNGSGNGGVYALDFSDEVEDVSFRINDIDGDGVVTVRAYDENGNPIEVNVTGGSSLTMLDTDGVPGDDTADSNGGYGPDSSANYSMLVDIPGPVARIEIIHEQDGGNNSGINVTDVYFDAIVDAGSSGDDTLIGGDGSDYADGGDGNDVIDTSGPVDTVTGEGLSDQGYPGILTPDPDATNDLDTVFGGAGNDTITTGDDDDVIDGGTGHDVINAGFDDDTVDGGSGDDFIVGGEGNDSIEAGSGNDTVYGGLDPSFPDVLNIPDAVDLRPDNGDDYIDGGAGDDLLYGQDDSDTILGGAGNDTISGGIDEDSLSGGDDRDTFIDVTVGDVIDGNEGGDDYDTLDLSGSDAPGGYHVVTYDANPENGTVEYFDNGGASLGTVTFSNIENVICFTPNTMIATPRGEVRIQDLREGDKVITRDNGMQEIRWIGHKPLAAADLEAQPHLKPILIKAGSLGENLPERDMMVSPQHRMLVANERTSLYFEEREVLVAAKHLLKADGIERAQVPSTTYIHMLFDQHEVVLANGAWTESFQPGDYSMGGLGQAQRNEIFALFPELKQTAGLDAYVAARPTLKGREAAVLFEA